MNYYIVTTHRAGKRLENVLQGIIKSNDKEKAKVYVMMDGSTADDWMYVSNFNATLGFNNPVEFFYVAMPDVHEITCLNTALMMVRMNNPEPDDLVFTLQDDVVLQEEYLPEKFRQTFTQYPNLGYVSMRLGCRLDLNSFDEFFRVESEFGHWSQPEVKSHPQFERLPHNHLAEVQIAIRSPTCVQWKRYAEVGFYDARLAPCGYDCHDFSLRMNAAGYQNAVLAMKFESKIEWGGMRKPSKINDRHGQIYEQNRQFLIQKWSKNGR